MLASVLKVSPEWLACETDENQPKIIVEPTKPKKDSDISLIKRKQATFVYTVDLPEGIVQSWVPHHSGLCEEEKRQALTAICRTIASDLMQSGTATSERPQQENTESTANEFYSTLHKSIQEILENGPKGIVVKDAPFSVGRVHRKMAAMKHKRTVRFRQKTKIKNATTENSKKKAAEHQNA